MALEFRYQLYDIAEFHFTQRLFLSYNESHQVEMSNKSLLFHRHSKRIEKDLDLLWKT